MKTFKNSRKAGISLVALVITIIVLIILTGAVIVTFMEGGIIDRAKEAVFKNDMRTYQEILALKRAENQMEIALGEKEDVEINASTLAEIQEIIPEFKEEYEGIVVITKGELSIGERVTGEELSSSEELYATWLSDLGIGLSRLPKNAFAKVEGLEVGDYVEYTPDGDNTTYSLLYQDSGYFIDESEDGWYNEGEEVELQTITRQSNINWRVLKNDGRQVTLISETPIDSIGLGNWRGFLNGPRILDEIYSEFYSGSKGTARNLNVEDVNEVMKVEIGKDVKPCYTLDAGIEGDKIFEFDKKATWGDVLDDERCNASDYIDSLWYPDENYREYELIYGYKGSTYEERNKEAYKLIFRNILNNENSNEYWLSSTGISSYMNSYTSFDVYTIENGYVTSNELAYAAFDGVCYGHVCSGRPIVILNSDVQVANPTAGGDTVDTAWKLK